MTASLATALSAPALFWAFTWFCTKSLNPFAFAREPHGGLSASKTQVILFTYVGLFIITAFYIEQEFALSKIEFDRTTGIEVPIYLASLMGISLVSMAGVKSIAINRVQEGTPLTADASTLTKDRDGSTDIGKGQMIVWSAITAVTYLMKSFQILNGDGEKINDLPALRIPDIDATMLVLMGVSQGGYLAGKLMNRETSTPIIESIFAQQERISILGTGFGTIANDAEVIMVSPEGKTTVVPQQNIQSWIPTRIEIDRRFPPANEASFAPGKGYKVRVRANAIASDYSDVNS